MIKSYGLKMDAEGVLSRRFQVGSRKLTFAHRKKQ
jgi:hypothetical protein